jgi:hypothetical protein
MRVDLISFVLYILWACETLRPYIIGNQFIVETDHESLKWLKDAKSPARLVRWAMRLSEFDFEVQHRRGKANANADCLSRLPIEAEEEQIKDLESYLFTVQTRSQSLNDTNEFDIVDEQKKDNELLMIHNSLKSGRTDTNIFKNYTVIDSILYRLPHNNIEKKQSSFLNI